MLKNPMKYMKLHPVDKIFKTNQSALTKIIASSETGRGNVTSACSFATTCLPTVCTTLYNIKGDSVLVQYRRNRRVLIMELKILRELEVVQKVIVLGDDLMEVTKVVFRCKWGRLL